MKSTCVVFLLFYFLFIFQSCNKTDKNPFWGDGEPKFEVRKIFDHGQHPNIVVAMDGSVIATFGRNVYQVRRSEDGGETWEKTDTIANPGFQGGGTIVDENTGDILIFSEDHHPLAPLTIYRSKDHGKSWEKDKFVIHPNSLGHIPSMHMNEHGITLKHRKYKGRLIRPSRYYAEGNDPEFWHLHYTNAVYSDDGGKTWQASEPFPAYGTGEAAIEELSDGILYYNSRRHKSTDGLSPRWRHVAWSYDGGHTWENLSVSNVLPDGNQRTDYGLMGGLIRLPVEKLDILLYSSIDIPKDGIRKDLPFNERGSERKMGTVWTTFDGGKSWPVKRLVEEGGFSYSSMAAGRKGTSSEGWIYLMYEGERIPGFDYRTGSRPGWVARFNLAWLTDGRDWKEFLDK